MCVTVLIGLITNIRDEQNTLIPKQNLAVSAIKFEVVILWHSKANVSPKLTKSDYESFWIMQFVLQLSVCDKTDRNGWWLQQLQRPVN